MNFLKHIFKYNPYFDLKCTVPPAKFKSTFTHVARPVPLAFSSFNVIAKVYNEVENSILENISKVAHVQNDENKHKQKC